MPSKVWECLYVGSDPTAKSIAAGRFDVVIFVAAERAHKGETFPDVEVFRFGIKDDPHLPLTHAEIARAASAALTAATSAADGKRVLVCCQSGLDRSPFVAAFALQRAGIDPETAIATVKEKRPGSLVQNPRLEGLLRHVVGNDAG